MPSVPSTIALTSIATSSQIRSDEHRNNYSAIQTAVNALIADLSSGTAGAVLYATSSSAVAYTSNIILDNTASKITLGGDTNLYRSVGNVLKTDDALLVDSGVYGGVAVSTDAAIGAYVQGDVGFDRFHVLGSGKLEWAAAAPSDTNLFRSAADTLKSDDGIWAAGGMVTKTKAGIPSDSDLVAGMQQSGAFILDTSNSRIYFRVGSTWKFAALT